MNHKLDTFRFAAPAFVVGGLMVAFSFQNLDEKGELSYEPNPGALAKSPFGRTIGMALQGPINRFWDRGIGEVEQQEEELADATRADEKLFNWVTELREAKTQGETPKELKDDYQHYAMARIEKKLELAWKMDPRNFANYAIYQMFLFEGFNDKVLESEMGVRELSLATLKESLADKESPVSLLTAGQAAYDLVFEARTAKSQPTEETFQDIETYSETLEKIISDYNSLVAAMQEDGRWELYSEAKKEEFTTRKAYLDHLNAETRQVVAQLTQAKKLLKGERNS